MEEILNKLHYFGYGEVLVQLEVINELEIEIIVKKSKYSHNEQQSVRERL